MGMKTIAEGVETQTQFEFLRSESCDAVQGFYFSKPLLPRSSATLLEKSQLVGERA